MIRVGYSKNPQSETSGRNQQPPGQAFPATIILSEAGANTYTNVGTFNDGVSTVPQFDLTVGHVKPAAGLTTYRDEFIRGRITSWNVSFQKLLPADHSMTLGYVANRQNGMTRNENVNYGKPGGGTASRPVRADSQRQCGHQRSIEFGSGHYDSFQASVNKRMSHGLQYTVPTPTRSRSTGGPAPFLSQSTGI